MSAQVLAFRQKPVTGTQPKPLLWQCLCGSQSFSFTEFGRVYCAGACKKYISTIKVDKR